MPRDLDVVEDICKATFADPEVAVVPEDVIDVDRTKKKSHTASGSANPEKSRSQAQLMQLIHSPSCNRISLYAKYSQWRSGMPKLPLLISSPVLSCIGSRNSRSRKRLK